MLFGLVLAIGLSAAALAADGIGEISGHIRITSRLTKRRITLPQVYERNAAIPAPTGAGADVQEREELRRVVVFLNTAALPAKARRITVDQRQRRFEPEVVAIPIGSTVDFPNSDRIFHNVFSFSRPKPFDLGNYPAGARRSVTFPEAGAVQLHCHLHANMSGAVLVTPNDWFTQPAEDGGFSLTGVPAGRYQVVAWHKTAGFFRRKVQVEPGAAVKLEFEIPLAELAVSR